MIRRSDPPLWLVPQIVRALVIRRGAGAHTRHPGPGPYDPDGAAAWKRPGDPLRYLAPPCQ